MDNRFYRAFEDRHRGSRELITGRLEVYLPFLAPLKALYPDAAVLDIGCGRGEWIELLSREGYAAAGVDLDEGMLEACRALGLPVRNDDALNALRQCADQSLIAVSGFHIAEHVPFEVLESMVTEAARVLRPGGLLILETPNAENLVVGTNNFFVDPTHERPIPSLLLSFLTDFKGFARSKVLRLQEAPDLHDPQRKLGVMDVLAGTSPDYAVIAQKQSNAEVLGALDALFDRDYGVSLDQLASRYDQALEGRLSKIENQMASDVRDILTNLQAEQAQRVQLIEATFERERALLQKSLEQMQQHAERLQAEMNQSLSNAHHWYERAISFEQQLDILRRSTAWRITAPLRGAAHMVLHPTQAKAVLRQSLRRVVPHARLWLARRPAIERKVLATLSRSPWLVAKLRALLKPDPAEAAADASDLPHGVIDHAPLTPRGRDIESALRQAMTKGNN
ncbi:methyltransferase domain-containing protein [Pantoea sp. Tr-811]|uniref:class I SAM-dependent methyltransferase n=1 Tax=Pantoea sp. Tr-811 TaxID=2608361 RepID=UPI0014222AEF|nr:class I SAM-dependent methyltransferase [Pantoea sp. Tr-811]NIF29511.1 methyltransferase domain-containing protein [Pantoea sp. Tr-811]